MTEQAAASSAPAPAGDAGDVRRQARSMVRSPALQAIRALVRAEAELSRSIARRAGLSPSEVTALEALSRGPLGPGEMARLLNVTTAAATGIVDRMTSHGHAERRPHPSDGRRTEVHLTESGRAELLAHLIPVFGRLAAHDAAFTDDERAVVTRYLEGAAAVMRAEALREDGPEPVS